MLALWPLNEYPKKLFDAENTLERSLMHRNRTSFVEKALKRNKKKLLSV